MAKNPPEYSYHAKKLAVEPIAAQDLAELGVSEDDVITLNDGDSDSSQKVTDFKDKAA